MRQSQGDGDTKGLCLLITALAGPLPAQRPYLLPCKWPLSHFLIRAGFSQITLIRYTTLYGEHTGTHF